MGLIGTRDVLALTGLSGNQLREWTGRRALILADVPASGKGTKARYSWQTVLVLRLALVLRDEFHLDLQHCSRQLAELQIRLKGRSFLSLQGHALVLGGESQLALVRASTVQIGHDALVVVPLERHLQMLMVALEDRSGAEQLPLFRARALP